MDRPAPHTPVLQRRAPSLRDPAGALHAVHRRACLRPGTVLMTLFDDPAARQRLLGTVRVWDSRTKPPGRDDTLVRTARAVRLLTVRPGSTSAWDPSSPPQLVIVAARHGPVIFRDSELGWIRALRRIDRQWAITRDGWPELLLVTEYGFRCWSDATAAHHPALRMIQENHASRRLAMPASHR